MMSKNQYLTDDGRHNWMAHLMFYTPLMDGAVSVSYTHLDVYKRQFQGSGSQ